VCLTVAHGSHLNKKLILNTGWAPCSLLARIKLRRVAELVDALPNDTFCVQSVNIWV